MIAVYWLRVITAVAGAAFDNAISCNAGKPA